VANWDDVRRIALALPDTNERPSRGHAFWRVRDKASCGSVRCASRT